ncbi:MAG TPA: hypothetical protein VJR92_09450 [Gemmatimonadaceae bacterium]|nr:hypothetical protein [Gemmatimonadaceae bacterium]
MHARTLTASLVLCFCAGAMAPVVYSSQTAQSTRAPAAAQESRDGWFGIALSCEACDAPAPDSSTRVGPLIVRSVARNVRFGPQPGDTIVAVNRTITDPRRMRVVLRQTPRDGEIVLSLRGAKGPYVVSQTKRYVLSARDRRDTLPVQYQAEFNKVKVEVLSTVAPVVRRERSGDLVITVDKHVVRLSPMEKVAYRLTTENGQR